MADATTPSTTAGPAAAAWAHALHEGRTVRLLLAGTLTMTVGVNTVVVSDGEHHTAIGDETLRAVQTILQLRDLTRAETTQLPASSCTDHTEPHTVCRDCPLSRLNLPMRSFNALRNHFHREPTVGEVAAMSVADLRDVRNLAELGARDVITQLQTAGLHPGDHHARPTH